MNICVKELQISVSQVLDRNMHVRYLHILSCFVILNLNLRTAATLPYIIKITLIRRITLYVERQPLWLKGMFYMTNKSIVRVLKVDYEEEISLFPQWNQQTRLSPHLSLFEECHLFGVSCQCLSWINSGFNINDFVLNCILCSDQVLSPLNLFWR